MEDFTLQSRLNQAESDVQNLHEQIKKLEDEKTALIKAFIKLRFIVTDLTVAVDASHYMVAEIEDIITK